ncbi:MAG TPA: Calx-beta domain-containing protein [Allosphingosinicella sp.]|nr:Calx-beta domain-containing protein [Allosphingosinicella sp.]
MLTASAATLASAVHAGETVTYSYDALGRLTATSSSDTVNPGATSSIGYDAAGNRSIYAASVSGAPAFSVSDVSGLEGRGLVFTIVKTGAGAASVTYATANGSAGAPGDYNAASGSLSFAAGESSKTVTIGSIDDSGDEAHETLSLNLSAASAGATIADSQGAGTILDNDEPPPPPPPPPPVFSIADASVAEGGMLEFTVTKTGPTTGSFMISYNTVNDTAVANFDHLNPGDYYMATSGIAFGPDEATKTITIHTVGDILDESDETLLLNLTSPTGGATISDAQAIGTIVDDDDPPPPPPGNDPPTPLDDTGSQKGCQTRYYDVLANDGDPNGDLPLTLVSSSNPSFPVSGTTMIEVDGSIISSGDSTVYTVRDTRNATATATLTVTLTTGRCSDD